MIISHRIQLLPNNMQKTYFRKAIGCARLAYNWGLAEWQRRYKEGERDISGLTLQKAFYAIKKEQFPFTYEVTKYATAHAFDDLQHSFDRFFAHYAQYPKPHKKKDGKGSFYYCVNKNTTLLSSFNPQAKYLDGKAYNTNGKHQYLNVPKLGYVKMTQKMRFNGRVVGVRIIQSGEKYYASFNVEITEEEYRRTHPHVNGNLQGAVGIDMGLKEAMTLSDCIAVKNPRFLKNNQRRISKINRQLSKRQHAKNKQERLKGVKKSNNYIKLSKRLAKTRRHVTNIRHDFTQKLTTILTTSYAALVIEDLELEDMFKNKELAYSVSELMLGTIRLQIERKAEKNGVKIILADRFFASSKTCSKCGYKNGNLSLQDRTFVCPHCGNVINRDLNASFNLRSLIKDQVGADYPELTPADLTALLSRFSLNGIATSKVETGRQHLVG